MAHQTAVLIRWQGDRFPDLWKLTGEQAPAWTDPESDEAQAMSRAAMAEWDALFSAREHQMQFQTEEGSDG